MKRRAIAVTALILTACTPMVWMPTNGQDERQFNTDRAQCEYEAAKAVQTNDPFLQTIVGQEFDKASRRADLVNMCLGTRGYVQRPKQQ